MEVILCLPFFLVVMLIGVGFGQGFFFKQRALVAARYAAWQEARDGEPMTVGKLGAAGFGGHALAVRCDDDPDAGGSGGLGRVALGVVGRIYGSLESAADVRCQVEYTVRPLGSVLPVGRPAGSLVVNLEDWRLRPERGSGPLGSMRDTFARYLRILGY